jgi:hypothetical protein
MQPNDVLIQGSLNADSGDEWHVIHRSAPMGSLAWVQALSVARRIAETRRSTFTGPRRVRNRNCVSPTVHNDADWVCQLDNYQLVRR